MTLLIGDTAPNFTANTTQGEIDFHQWSEGSWVVLFSHPKDFTPVCTTELGEVAKLSAEFNKRSVKTIALSVDDVESHHAWIKDIEQTQNTAINYPIIADEDRNVSCLYTMIHPNASDSFTVRSVFIIDPQHKVRLSINYPASTGRNFTEILRVIDSIQLTEHHSVATPVNWQQGEDCVIIPTISNEEAAVKFPQGFTEIKPYLRMTACPDVSS